MRGDKRGLSRRRAEPRSDSDVAQAIARQIKALAVRVATADPDAAKYLRLIEQQLTEAWADAVAGWRASGFSDSEIGTELSVTKQAVQQHWPRAGETNPEETP